MSPPLIVNPIGTTAAKYSAGIPEGVESIAGKSRKKRMVRGNVEERERWWERSVSQRCSVKCAFNC